MSATVLLPKIPIDAAHSFFRKPLPVGSEAAERWLAWFKLRSTTIEVVTDMGFVQIYKHYPVATKICGGHTTIMCCQKGDTGGHKDASGLVDSRTTRVRSQGVGIE